jgi:hypothetical protein
MGDIKNGNTHARRINYGRCKRGNYGRCERLELLSQTGLQLRLGSGYKQNLHVLRKEAGEGKGLKVQVRMKRMWQGGGGR